MGVREIMERMKNEANAERERIVSEAKGKADEMLKKAREELELRKKNFIEAEEKRGVEERERIVRAARLNARKLRWKVEEEMIGKALEGATKRMKEIKKEGFNGKSYSTILTGLIKDAALSITAGSSAGGELEVMLSEEDASASFVKPDMLKKIADEINQDKGVNVSLSLSGERIKSAGGVIVRGKEGKIEVNNTFEQRMARFFTSLREEVLKTLFTTLSF